MPGATKFLPRSALTHSSFSLWHQADVQTALMNVRFEGNNGHGADVSVCPLDP